MHSAKNHPAVMFATWLKSQRRSRGIIARTFAGKLWLSPAKYAEIELGIVHWFTEKQEQILPVLLELSTSVKEEFLRLLKSAREAVSLKFSDLFTRDELRPVRTAHSMGKQLSEEDVERLLDVVFTEIPVH